MKLSFSHTRRACYVGYITQAIVNNYSPLLFVTFAESFGISLVALSGLITANFGIQLTVDLLSARFVDKIGYRTCGVISHLFCFAGFVMLGTLPFAMTNSFAGIVIATVFNGIGGGLLEVIISPIVEAIPGDDKPGSMSLLHSFYCWGQMGVVLLSTLFFRFCGVRAWFLLSFIWAIVPFVNMLVFTKVPIRTLEDNTPSMPVRELIKKPLFAVFMLMMLCSGASELSMSQWASAFAEKSLGVGKTVGDLLGPCLFAVLMGIMRVVYSRVSSRVSMDRFLGACCVLCIASYLTAALCPLSFVALGACCLCGLSVGIMWPGVFSEGAASLPAGGTAMFALFALAGDLGCCSGPAGVGLISKHFGNTLTSGLLAAAVFPLLMLLCIFAKRRVSKD